MLSLELSCNTRVINVIPESLQDQLMDAWTDDMKLYPQTIEEKFSSRVLRLNQGKIRLACQVIGCKPFVADKISDKIMEHYVSLARFEYPKLSPNLSEKYLIYTTNEKFIEVLTKTLGEYSVAKKRSIFDFHIGLSIVEQTTPMIVLLGGTSGSGKSTVASLLAYRFGIPTVLSTDTIRHITRNFMSAEECPVLFASTYEAGNKIQLDENISEKKRIILGFQQQAAIVQEKLDSTINSFYSRGESIVVEGVHLTPDFMASTIAKYNNCIPFLIYIRSENKHRGRFAVRSKYMTLEKKHNKYIQNFSNIRDIQRRLVKKADEYLVPKVNNSNIDKSVGIIHRTIVRCLRRIAVGESLFDPEKKNAIKIYAQFNEVTKNIWSSDTVKQYINSKVSKTNKTEIVKSFLFKENEEDIRLNTKLDTIQIKSYNNINEALGQGEGDNEEFEEDKEEEETDINKNGIDKVSLESIPKKDSQYRYKEDILFSADDSYNLHSKNTKIIKRVLPEARDPLYIIEESNNSKKETGFISTSKNSSSILELPDEKEYKILIDKVSTSHEEASALPSPLKNAPVEKEYDETLSPSSQPKLIEAIEENYSSPQNTANATFFQYRVQLKFAFLEGLLADKRMISMKKNVSNYYLKRIKKFIKRYNKRHPDLFARLYSSNDKYIIYKHNRPDSVNLTSIALDSNDPIPKVSFTKTPRKVDPLHLKIYESDRKNAGKFTESGTSEDGSEDELSLVSAQSQDRHSNLSGSMDANFHLTGIGSNVHNLSDHIDISDDFESIAKIDEDSEGRTSLEIVESANSISEQTEEDDEDEDTIIYQQTPKLVK